MTTRKELDALLERVHGGFSSGNLEPGAPVKHCGQKVKIPKGCEYLNKAYLVTAPKKAFDRIRKKAVVGPETKIKHKFRGDTTDSDAISQTVKIDGRYVLIIRPKQSVSPKHLPSTDQIVKALGAVPSKQLDKINTVVLNNQRNPKDAYWAKEYKDPNFYSAATGGPGGVTFYPTDNPYDQSRCDSNAIHEGGHAYSGDLWKDKWLEDDWKEAIAADKQSPSTYSDKAPTEDFSESLVMYSLSKGTPCEATARAMYPNRYAELDRLLQ